MGDQVCSLHGILETAVSHDGKGYGLMPLAPRQIDLVERLAQSGRQLLGVIIGPEVHEEQPRLVIERVVRRDPAGQIVALTSCRVGVGCEVR
jgi:hypothetical protein